MLLRAKAGPYSLHGVSLGGVYTCIHVPELGVLLDAGIAPRSLAGVSQIFLTHGHADHVGGLAALLGIRGLSRLPPPLVYLPEQIAAPLEAALAALSVMQGAQLSMAAVPVRPGAEHELRPDLWVRVLDVPHGVPTVGYQFFSRVHKLRAAYHGVAGAEIARRRLAGEELFDTVERLQLAYITDTRASVFEAYPSLLETRVLIVECTFLDDRKDPLQAQDLGHIHLDELLKLAPAFNNECVVLTHFSQIYSPKQVHELLKRRCPADLYDRLVVFAPSRGTWPG